MYMYVYIHVAGFDCLIVLLLIFPGFNGALFFNTNYATIFSMVIRFLHTIT